MKANMTQYKAPTIGRGMEARTAPNFPVHGQKCSTISLKLKFCNYTDEK